MGRRYPLSKICDFDVKLSEIGDFSAVSGGGVERRAAEKGVTFSDQVPRTRYPLCEISAAPLGLLKMNFKRKHRRHHGACGLCKPHKKGWEDPRTTQEKRQDAAESADRKASDGCGSEPMQHTASVGAVV